MKKPHCSLLENGTGLIVLDNPEHKNKINPFVLEDIMSCMNRLASENAHAVVLTGKGGVFSAGYDIERVAEDFSLDSEHSLQGMNILERTLAFIEDFHLPTVAMIDGYCIGAAFEMACAFDFRIATAGSGFGITPAKIGLVYPFSGIKRVYSIVGNPFAKEMLLTGNIYSAERMYEKGFLNFISSEDIQSETLAFIERIRANSYISVRGMKKSINEFLSGNPDETFCRELTEKSLKGDHIREGRNAFFDKRKPVFE